MTATSLLPGVSVVIPVYNSEPTLSTLLSRLHDVLGGLGQPFEIVLVDDASSDGSWRRIEELSRATPALRGIALRKNAGQHNALLAGIRAARHEIAVTLDDDLQNPPEELPLLLDKLADGHDVVYGVPIERRHGMARDAATALTKLALRPALGPAARDVSPYRAFRTELRDAFSEYAGPHVSIDVLLGWATARFTAVPVRHDPRATGRSNYNVGRLVAHAVNMVTGYSTRPLQLASFVGFTFALLGAGVLAYVVGRRIVSGVRVPGFAFLASITAIFSGAQLFALGIIGEYLARLHLRTMQKPPYVVRSVVGGGDESAASDREHRRPEGDG